MCRRFSCCHLILVLLAYRDSLESFSHEQAHLESFQMRLFVTGQKTYRDSLELSVTIVRD